MRLEIYTFHEAKKTYDNISLITAPTPMGEKGFLQNHMEFISELDKGLLKFTDKGNHHHKVPVEKGYVNFYENVCKVFILTELNAINTKIKS